MKKVCSKQVILSNKERFRLKALIFFAIFITLAMYSIYGWQKTVPKNAFLNAKGEIVIPPRNRDQIALRPTTNELNFKNIQSFVIDRHILANTEDDQYLKTEGFYYLLHKAMQYTPKQIESELVTKIIWRDLALPKTTQEIRGKALKVTGNLLEIKKQVLKSIYAQKRGLSHLAIWRGALYSPDGHLYLFAVTSFPENIHIGDAVALTGFFLKSWTYEVNKPRNSREKMAKAPFLIGKKISKLLPAKKTTTASNMIWGITIAFVTIVFLLGYALLAEHHEIKKQKQQRKKRKQRLLDRAKQNKDNGKSKKEGKT